LNLADPIRAHARGKGDAVAIVRDGTTVTYGELDRLADGCAAWIAGRGIRPGQVVGLTAGEGPGHLVVVYGLARAGAILLPLDQGMPPADRLALAEGLGAAVVLGHRDEVALPGIRFVRLASAPWHAAAPAAPIVGDGESPVHFSLSAGTTGRPKAVLYSHRLAILMIERLASHLGLGEADRSMSLVDLRFNFGRVAAMRTLHVGGTVVLPPGEGVAERLDDLILRHRVSWLTMTPAHLRAALAARPDGTPPLAGLRRAIVSGAMLPEADRAAGLARLTPTLTVLYGTNEVGPISVLMPEDRPLAAGCVGRPVPGIEVRVVDEQGADLAPGEVGRIRFRGDCVPSGYHNHPEATRSAFRDGWFQPGDLAMLDRAGAIHLRGRFDDLINVDGRKVYPVEIEAVLAAHPAVRDVAVVGVPQPNGAIDPVAFVVLGAAVGEAELTALCRRRLQDFKVPRRVLVLDALPRSALGKVRGAALVEMAAAVLRPVGSGGDAAIRTG